MRYMCEYCNASFDDLRELEYHNQFHEINKDIKIAPEIDSGVTLPKRPTCHVCNDLIARTDKSEFCEVCNAYIHRGCIKLRKDFENPATGSDEFSVACKGSHRKEYYESFGPDYSGINDNS